VTVPCKACREQIEAGATVCKECGSSQGPSRHLFYWKDIIVAVGALAPLWIAATALYKTMVADPRADIRMLALRCDTDSMQVAASNLGTAAGLVGPANLSFITASGISDPGVELRIQEPEDFDPVVAPSATKILNLQPRIHGAMMPIPYPQVGKPCSAVAEVSFLGFDGSLSRRQVTCACPE
jgi:hypothetical protein